MPSPIARLPYAHHRALTPVRIAMAAVGLATFATAMAVIVSPYTGGIAAMWPVALCGIVAGLFSGSAWVAVRATSRWSIAGLMIALPATTLAAVFGLVGAAEQTGQQFASLGVIVYSALGAGGGALGGIVALVPIFHAAHVRGPTSHDAGDRALVVSGTWAAMACWAIAVTQPLWTVGWRRYVSPVHAWLPLVVACFWCVVLAATAMVVLGVRGVVRRKRWLAAVRRGEMVEYQILPATENDVTLLPFIGGGDQGAVLVWSGARKGYRESAQPVRLCRVRLLR